MQAVDIIFYMNNRVLTFKGTHREIGEQVGLLYKKWGHTYSYMPPFADEYYPTQLKIYEKHFPKHLEYLEGIAKSAGVPKDRIFKISLTIFLSFFKKVSERKCSCFIVHNKNGVLIGRTYDWVEASEKHSKVIKNAFTDNSSFDFIGISDMGTYKVGQLVDKKSFTLVIEEAKNSKGLYIELNGGPGKKNDFGMSSVHAFNLIAEQCQTVEEAISKLEGIPLTISQIFCLADQKRNMAVVEKSLDKGMRVRTNKKFIIATNHYNYLDLISLNKKIFEKVPFHSSFARYHYLESHLIEKWSNLDLKVILPLMKAPPTLQNWRGKERGDVVTCWISALNLKNKEYLVHFAPLISEEIISV